MKTNEYVSDRGERFCVLPPKAGDPIRGAPSPSSPEIIYDMRVTVKGIEKNLKALCAAHKKIGWTLDNFEDDLQVIRRVIDTATSDENAARRAALLLQKEVDELANNTCLPFMKMWDLMCELEVIPLQLKTREADISDDFCVDLFEKTRREMGLFDAFVEADLLLVRMPALPSIRAHGAVVNGRKMVIYDTQMFVEKVRGAFITASRLPALTPTTTQRKQLPMKFARISRVGTMVIAPISAFTQGCRRPFRRGLTSRFLPWKGRFQRRRVSSKCGNSASEAVALLQALKKPKVVAYGRQKN